MNPGKLLLISIVALNCLWAAAVSAAEWGDLTGRLIYARSNREDAASPAGIADAVIYRRTSGAVHDKLNDEVHGKVRLNIRSGRFDRRIVTLWRGEQTLAIRNH